MIFIVGGMGQGKAEFALEQFPELKYEILSDGESASWEEFMGACFGMNLQAMIRRRLENGETSEVLEREMAQELLKACPERVILADEIGCGIVPVDTFSRNYREVTGRICCQLAREAKEVWRVVAGIGQRIK